MLLPIFGTYICNVLNKNSRHEVPVPHRASENFPNKTVIFITNSFPYHEKSNKPESL